MIINKLQITIIILSSIMISGCATNEKFVKIKANTINVKVADTIPVQTRGLGGINFLADGQGMLFVFPDYKTRSFWMKDMLISIDIIWINRERIVGIEKNAPVAENKDLINYYSPLPVNLVLEVPAGYCDRKKINIGDKIEYHL